MVYILDATLREGEQTPGVYFDIHIKMAIANLLNQIGVDYIEAGHPAVSDEIRNAISHIAHMNTHAKIGAHTRSIQNDVDQAINCNVQFLGIFYCVSNGRLDEIHNKSLTHAIENITKTIDYARQRNPDLIIRYTPEDTVRTDFENVIKASTAAIEAGANIISIADTTGYMIPGTRNNMYDYVFRFKSRLQEIGLQPMIAVHCHNDRGFALANAIDGYRAGAEILDASILGLGERAGIVDLAQLLVTLHADFQEKTSWKLHLLPELYSLVSRFTGIPIPVNFPIIGKNAFTHCAGIHTHAATINPIHYQSINPSIVGRKTEICLDNMAGLSSVKFMLKQNRISADHDLAVKVLNEVKHVGRKGRIVNDDELRYIVTMCKQQKD